MRPWASGRRPVRPGPPSRRGKPAAGKIGDFKISLAEWSLHKALFAKKIDNLDFPKIAREQYGIEGVEFVNQFFKDKAHDSAYLKDLKTRANDHGVTCVLIMIDGEGDLSATDKDEAGRRPSRTTRSGSTPPRPSAATRSGSTPASNYSPTDVGAVAEACGALTEYGEKHRINDHLREPRRAVEQPRRPARPDEGRRQARLRHAARLRQLPQGPAGQVHDRRLRRDRPDDALRQGRLRQELRLRRRRASETTLDYARIIKIVTDAGYHGFVGIEYEGSRLSEPEGITATKKLLESLRGSTYQPAV